MCQRTRLATSYTDAQGIEQAVLLVYAYSPKRFGFYRAPAHALSTNSWTQIGETNVLDSDDQFQCFGLVTQASAGEDVVYI
ncbi:hypothetical protein [Stigmatella aurantiaca]|uniref:Uncharacterized protein n=1 Tax=Stigmatella aurantiaca (strain DW4/3-1) TaxID=378806 RepID=E3FMB4_STIAD|nr:hypothetical protein [Stigmatella aurantiaca]ADO69313.1 uncharacterized protein STAUR_1509 [Stigmatella aurantiaca DW4/3-1]